MCCSIVGTLHIHLCTDSRYSNYTVLGGGEEIPWCFSQVKGTIEDEVADGKMGNF